MGGPLPCRSAPPIPSSSTTPAPAAYGEWYSDRLNITGGTNYQLRYNLRYIVTNVGPMRVTVNFYNAANAFLSGVSYLFAGAHDFWEEMTQQFTTPTRRSEAEPLLHFRRWRGCYRPGLAGRHFPGRAGRPPIRSCLTLRTSRSCLIRSSSATGSKPRAIITSSRLTPTPPANICRCSMNTPRSPRRATPGPAFGLPSYVGRPRDSGEALTALGAVLGGTLAGLDMASLNGTDRVQQCEVFYCVVNGHGLVLNNVNSQGSGSAWYDIFPSTLFYQIGARYPGRASFQAKMRAIADSWLAALPVLSNNWEHTGFNFQTMAPADFAWNEPDMAIGIAWLEYMAYVQFQDPKYLDGRRYLHDPNGQPRPPIPSTKRSVSSARRLPPA